MRGGIGVDQIGAFREHLVQSSLLLAKRVPKSRECQVIYPRSAHAFISSTSTVRGTELAPERLLSVISH